MYLKKKITHEKLQITLYGVINGGYEKYIQLYWGFLKARGHLEDLNAN
jgi:hypothetical protein